MPAERTGQGDDLAVAEAEERALRGGDRAAESEEQRLDGPRPLG